VSDILAGKRSISADTAHRLGLFFRMEPEQWLALQSDWDLSRVTIDAEILPLDPPGFLLGPLGATPLPSRRPQRPTLSAPRGHSPQPRQPAVHAEVRYPDGTRALVVK